MTESEIRTNKENFISIVRANIKRDGIENLIDWLNKSDFFTAPSSTRFHGNYEGGYVNTRLMYITFLRNFLVNLIFLSYTKKSQTKQLQ